MITVGYESPKVAVRVGLVIDRIKFALAISIDASPNVCTVDGVCPIFRHGGFQIEKRAQEASTGFGIHRAQDQFNRFGQGKSNPRSFVGRFGRFNSLLTTITS